MNKPAARVTDRVAHPPKYVLTNGSISSKTMGKLAKRMRKGSANEKLQKLIDKTATNPDIEAAENPLMSDVLNTLASGSSKNFSQDLLENIASNSMSKNVVIEGLPAWRAVIDIHVCPSHGPGVVINGSSNVLINGFPATRMGDTLVEGGNNFNTIIQGANTVVIGG